MSNNQLLITNIENIIKEKGIKKCVVAERAGLTPNMFSSMLNERKVITAEHIPNIAINILIVEIIWRYFVIKFLYAQK